MRFIFGQDSPFTFQSSPNNIKIDGSVRKIKENVSEIPFFVTLRTTQLPQKIRDLLKALKEAGFSEIGGAGKGSHRKFIHPDYPGAVTISGKSGDDAKRYQEKQVSNAIESIKR